LFDIKPTLFLLKQNNIAEGTVVSTFNQTKGRGNANNNWLSEADKNLSISIIYKPKFLLAKQQFYLNMAICLGIIDALKPTAQFTIKWPNDIYYKNYKVAGLLIENTLIGENLKHSVIGIGLNVNQVYLNNLYLYEEVAKFKVNNKMLNGTIRGINETGKLLIEMEDEIISFGFKEIGFVV